MAMRQTLEDLEQELRLGSDYTEQAIYDLKEVVSKLIALMDLALPKEVELD